jgi:hypothetical protein
MHDIPGRGVVLFAAGLIAVGVSAHRAASEQPGPLEPPVMNESWDAVKTPEMVIRKWPEFPLREARALIARYGEPDRFDDGSLAWDQNGPWLETIVYREPRPSFTAGRGRDILEQSIPYAVPQDKIAELERFDDRLEFDKASGELSSRSGSETLNYLALNLADEIVNGKRTANQARDFYRRTLSLEASGKSSPYLQGFLFHIRPASPAPK